ncbi:TetR/AcrR family transcriptional regulator [Derxia lacustris]|uniref:TetR/AcrR family transcriptional regulator n=1 Tax=Derxia lacustris TaxID=764842 RepID=UPI00159375D8|nr:TetR/AcrR family transcriptional regulator [Derxia lacustris]
MSATTDMASRSYHHGSLRDTLVQAALAVIERDGHEALSLRELAQAAGVSSAAPYRHFADRAAVLAAVACAGYEDLRRDCEAVAADPALDPPARLRALARAFIAFSRLRPGLFRLMFDGQPPGADSDPALLNAEAECYAAVVAVAAPALPRLDAPALRLRIVTLWATLYGYSMAGQRHRMRPYMTEGLDEAGIDAAIVEAAIGPLDDLPAR